MPCFGPCFLMAVSAEMCCCKHNENKNKINFKNKLKKSYQMMIKRKLTFLTLHGNVFLILEEAGAMGTDCGRNVSLKNIFKQE